MPRPTASVQLYTVRDALAADLSATLQRLADLGVRTVEPFGLVEAAATLGPALAVAHLTAPTSHVTLHGGVHEAAFDAARELGVTTLIDPYIPEERWTTRSDVAALAAEFTQIGRQAADHGLQVAYHNHWWELETLVDGTPALEVFADELGDAPVALELDTYWSAVGGVDPVALLGRLGERVVALHIKDGPVSRDTTQQQPAGQGAMPIAEILAAAPTARPVIEFDEYAGDLFEGIAASIAHLRSLGVEL